MTNCFLRNIFNSILSYFSHGLICPNTLVGDYNKVYIHLYMTMIFVTAENLFMSVQLLIMCNSRLNNSGLCKHF